MKQYVYVDYLQSMNAGELSLFGLDYLTGTFTLASIQDLQNEIEKQKQMLSHGVHPDGMICPWSKDETLVVQEGEYKWNGESEKYIKK